MTMVVATATREGRWWVVEIEGVGVTQGRNLAEARSMAADLVVVMTGAAEDAIEIELKVELEPELAREIAAAKAAVADLAVRQQEAAAASRQAARDLVEQVGVSGRDAAVILGVSAQRVSQLLAG